MTSFEHSIKNIYLGGEGGSPGRLPAEYQEVEYIQSSGTQYIDTTHKHTADSKVELKFNYQSMSQEWNLLFGSRQSYTSNTAFDIFVHYSSYIGYTCGGSDVTSFYSSSTDTDYTISLSKNNVTINGNSTAISTNLTSYGYNDWLFNFNEGGNPISGCYPVKAKVYYCKIWESNTLVRDLVPCYRIADSVIGMYDLVNDVFYTNTGTGTFTKGPNV